MTPSQFNWRVLLPASLAVVAFAAWVDRGPNVVPVPPKWDTRDAGPPVLPSVVYPQLKFKDPPPEREGDLWKVTRLVFMVATYQPRILIIEVFGSGLRELKVRTPQGQEVGTPDVQTSEARSTAIRLPYGPYHVTVTAAEPKVDFNMRFE